MKTLYLLFNHRLTPEQEADAGVSLGVERFAHMPEELQRLWSQVPAGENDLSDYLMPVKQWIQQASAEDYVLIQGDYGATFHLVNYCRQYGHGIPLHSTTERKTEELRQPDGSIEVKRSIRHVQFREYR